MNRTLKAWWATRTLREQRLLLLAGGLFAVVFVWLLIVRPIGDTLSRVKARHGAAALALAEARAQAALIDQLQSRAAPAAGLPLDALISRSATAAGFPVARVEPEGAGVATLFSNSVRPQAFFTWVGQMEKGQGLAVERLSAVPNTDQTLTVQVTFRSRSR